MLILSSIIERINSIGIAHQILFYFWFFVVIPLALVLIIVVFKNSRKENKIKKNSKKSKLEDGKYKMLQSPDILKYPNLVVLEKLSANNKNRFLFVERDKNDLPKFIPFGSLIIKETVAGEKIIKIKKSILRRHF